jgi:transcriptional regulator with XRE-family HTH domain
MAFPETCRRLRRERRLKASEVGAGIDAAESTVYNLECNNFKTIRLDRVYKLAQLYNLDQTATEALVAAWNELPVSAYNEANGPRWKRNQTLRAKAKERDELALRLVEVLAVWIGSSPDPDAMCACPEADPFDTESEPKLCELCSALRALGCGWTTWQEVLDRLVKIQEALSGTEEKSK